MVMNLKPVISDTQRHSRMLISVSAVFGLARAEVRLGLSLELSVNRLEPERLDAEVDNTGMICSQLFGFSSLRGMGGAGFEPATFCMRGTRLLSWQRGKGVPVETASHRRWNER